MDLPLLLLKKSKMINCKTVEENLVSVNSKNGEKITPRKHYTIENKNSK